MFKVLSSLKPGDVLKKSFEGEFCKLEHIIKADAQEKESNFCFSGFNVKGKGMKKIFKTNNSGEFYVFEEG